jgi:hypothetical protein
MRAGWMALLLACGCDRVLGLRTTIPADALVCWSPRHSPCATSMGDGLDDHCDNCPALAQ